MIQTDLNSGGGHPMLEKFKNNKFITQLFSVLIAIILWLFLIHTVNPQITQRVNNVPVTFKGLDALREKGLIPVDIDKSSYVDVTIRGQRTNVIKALAEITAVADLSSVSVKGTRIENVIVDTGVAGVYIDGRGTPTVSVELDELAEKTVPIEIIHNGTEKNKQTIAVSNSKLKSMTLNGAKTELDNIEKVVVNIDASDIDKKETVLRNFIYCDKEGSKVIPDTVKSTDNTIEVTSGLYPRKSLPVRVVLPDDYSDNYSIEYTLKSKEVIDVGIVSLDTDVEEICAEINPENFDESDGEYELELIIPDGIFVPDSMRIVKAEIKLTKTKNAKLMLDAEIRNLKDGLVTEKDSYKVDVAVTGPDDELKKDKIKAYIDAKDLNEGEHEVTVMIDAPDKVRLKEENRITINIMKQEG